MDLATVGGIVFTMLIVVGVGIGPSRIALFIDIPSIAIVIGGTLGATFISFPLKKVLGIGGIVKNAFFAPVLDPIGIVKQIVEFAEQARREGILSLEAKAHEIKDDFLKKGIQLAVDGTEPELIKDILTAEIEYIEQRHGRNSDVMGAMSALGPSYGMIGTLVGLVLMLVNMSDPSAIGPAMAVALLTTMYGSVLANMFFTPFETKLKEYNADEILVKTIMLEGIMSLQSGDNPRIVEQKLASFIDPATRLKVLSKQ